MTPRQLHALGFAVDECERRALFPSEEALRYHEKHTEMARKALAFAWREYRASRIDARERPARRALQCVRLK